MSLPVLVLGSGAESAQDGACDACGQPMEADRHPLARYCLRPACISQRKQARLEAARRKKVAA